MDFAKAIDKILHVRLLHKLDYNGTFLVHPLVDQLVALWAHSTSSLR